MLIIATGASVRDPRLASEEEFKAKGVGLRDATASSFRGQCRGRGGGNTVVEEANASKIASHCDPVHRRDKLWSEKIWRTHCRTSSARAQLIPLDVQRRGRAGDATGGHGVRSCAPTARARATLCGRASSSSRRRYADTYIFEGNST